MKIGYQEFLYSCIKIGFNSSKPMMQIIVVSCFTHVVIFNFSDTGLQVIVTSCAKDPRGCRR